MNDNPAARDPVFAEMTPGTFQQFVVLLIERVKASQLPSMAGMIRLRGRLADLGRDGGGKYYFDAMITDDGGTRVKTDIPISLVTSRGIAAGQNVILSGRLVVKSTPKSDFEVKLSASDIQLEEQEEAAQTADIRQGRTTLELLQTLPHKRVLFPDRDVVSVALIQSGSSTAQVAGDCTAELSKLGDAVSVRHVPVNMLDPVAIATAIREVLPGEIIMMIRGGGDMSDFEVFNDPRVITALAEHKEHRVLGLGHTGNKTLLDLVADYSAETPAQAGAYVRKQIQQKQRLSEELRTAREQVQEKQRLLNEQQIAQERHEQQRSRELHVAKVQLQEKDKENQRLQNEFYASKAETRAQAQEKDEGKKQLLDKLDAPRTESQEKERAGVQASKGKIVALTAIPAFLAGAAFYWFVQFIWLAR